MHGEPDPSRAYAGGHPAVSAPLATSGWEASLELEFRAGEARTFLAHCRHRGPLRVQREFHESGGTCQVYLVHPPGGVVAGDLLEVQVKACKGAQVLVTSPGATKFYRSAGSMARQRHTLTLQADACVEWLPQEVIVFDGAHAEVTTRVQMDAAAKIALWDIVSLGRSGSVEQFMRGGYRQRTEIWREDRPVFLEHQHYLGADAALRAPWGLSGRPVFGTLVLHPALPELVDLVRDLRCELEDGWFAATCVRDVVICRYLGYSSFYAREVLARAWAMLRPHVLGKRAEPPRIWAV